MSSNPGDAFVSCCSAVVKCLSHLFSERSRDMVFLEGCQDGCLTYEQEGENPSNAGCLCSLEFSPTSSYQGSTVHVNCDPADPLSARSLAHIRVSFHGARTNHSVSFHGTTVLELSRRLTKKLRKLIPKSWLTRQRPTCFRLTLRQSNHSGKKEKKKKRKRPSSCIRHFTIKTPGPRASLIIRLGPYFWRLGSYFVAPFGAFAWGVRPS